MEPILEARIVASRHEHPEWGSHKAFNRCYGPSETELNSQGGPGRQSVQLQVATTGR